MELIEGQRLIGIDPGLVTGVVSLSVFENEIHNVEALQLDQMALGHYMETVHAQWRKCGDRPIVICESFTITPQTGKNSQAPWSLENIGIVRFFCGKAGFELVFQTPAAAKRLATDPVLKAAGLYWPGKGHAVDAARHIFLYMVTKLKVGQEALKEA